MLRLTLKICEFGDPAMEDVRAVLNAQGTHLKVELCMTNLKGPSPPIVRQTALQWGGWLRRPNSTVVRSKFYLKVTRFGE